MQSSLHFESILAWLLVASCWNSEMLVLGFSQNAEMSLKSVCPNGFCFIDPKVYHFYVLWLFEGYLEYLSRYKVEYDYSFIGKYSSFASVNFNNYNS